MSESTFVTVCVAAALIGAAGCGSRSPEVDRKPNLLAPAAIDDHVVFVDSGRARAHLVDVGGDTPPAAPVVVPLVKNATNAVVRNGHPNELLILCAGQADTSRDVVPEQPGLVKIDTNGKATTYRYDSAFDRMVQSDDGKYAFLFFGPGTGDDSTLRNPNEVAIVDLDGSRNPIPKTLRSLGQTPQNVVFSPDQMDIAGTPRSLAVVLLQRDVAVIDLSHPDLPEFTVELTKPGGATLNAAQVLFSKETKPKIYLRAEGSDDVFAITLEPRTAATSGDGGASDGNDFSLNFSQLGAGTGSGPTDIEAFPDGEKTRLLVAAPGNSTAVLIDTDTDRTMTIGLPMAASRILRFEGPAPGDDTPAQRALLYSPGGTSVTFLNLAGLGTENNRNGKPELLQVPQQYVKIAPLGDGTAVDKVMLVHQQSGLSILNLGERTLSPITGPNLVDAIPDLEVEKLWLTPPGDRLGFLALSNYHPNEVRLDADIEHFVVVPSAHRRKVVVTHPDPLGYLTALDAKNPTSLGSAFAVSGYLFENVLGGGQ